MSSSLSQHSARILVVEGLQSRRMMMTEAFRKNGWNSVLSVASMKDVIALFESDPLPVDWLITPLTDSTNINALHLLALAAKTEKMRSMRVSLIIEPGFEYVLPGAYAMGLMSHHMKSMDTTSQMRSLLEVPAAGLRYDWQEPLMAAEFLRTALINAGQFEDLIALERALLAMYPGRPELVLRFAEACLLGGRPHDTIAILTRATEFPKNLTVTADNLLEKATLRAGGAGRDACAVPNIATRFGIKSALVVDPDEVAASHTVEVLRGLGISDIAVFHDGQSAWEWCVANREPDIIMQEWRIPKIAGDIFIQKIRQNGWTTSTVIVFSSLVKQSDRVLLREMGVSDVIEKPQTEKKFAQILSLVVQQDRRPEEEKSLERKIRLALNGRNIAQAKQLFEKLASKSATNPGLLRSFEAEFAFYEGKTSEAKRLATEVVRLQGEDVFVLNLLGKIYHKLGHTKEAARLFGRATELSPQNIERLCKLAEVRLDQGDVEGAGDAVNAAKKLDNDSTIVLEADAKVALAAGDTKKVKTILQSNEDNSRLIAFMNNRAVTLVAQNKIAAARDLYSTALKALPRQMNHLAPLIRYNLALAAIRSGKMDDAVTHLLAAENVDGVKETPARAKIKSLLKRSSKARQAGEVLTLKSGPASAGNQGSDDPSEEFVEVIDGLPVRSGSKPGDYCCHLVFQPLRGVDARMMQMLANAPRFRERQATLGFDAKNAS